MLYVVFLVIVALANACIVYGAYLVGKGLHHRLFHGSRLHSR